MAGWLRQLFPLVVGVAGLSVLCPHAHSTHVCPLFSLTHPCLHSHIVGSSSSRRGRCCSPHAPVEGSLGCSWAIVPIFAGHVLHPHAQRVVHSHAVRWSVDSRAERCAVHPRAGRNPHTEIGYVFPRYFCCWMLLGRFPMFLAVLTVCVLLAVGSNFVLDHWGLPIRWMCSLLSMLGVVLPPCWDCVSCQSLPGEIEDAVG